MPLTLAKIDSIAQISIVTVESLFLNPFEGPSPLLGKLKCHYFKLFHEVFIWNITY